MRSDYDVIGFRATVQSDKAEFLTLLDRLNAEFRVAPDTSPAAGISAAGAGSYAVRRARVWEVDYTGEVEQDRTDHPDLLDALDHVEWHICDQAIRRRNDLLHVHGAALAGPHSSVLLPGKSGIGKTTFALALALRERDGRRRVRMLSDDVVFLRTDSWCPESFPRAFHMHDDALLRLAPLGLRFEPTDVIDDHLCVRVLGAWDHSPGPPLRHVVFPQLDPDGPLALEPITAAEATLELLRYSKNLKTQPRFGLDLLPALLERVECYVLRRNDDLAGAADMVLDLMAR